MEIIARSLKVTTGAQEFFPESSKSASYPVMSLRARPSPWGCPLGVTNLLMLKGKNQALIEMKQRRLPILWLTTTRRWHQCFVDSPVTSSFPTTKSSEAIARPTRHVLRQPALQAPNSVQSANLALAASVVAVDAGAATAGQSPVLRIVV